MRYLTLGILAHVDAGKTTLSESMLYNSGTIRRIGRVDHKDAFLDTYDMEKERGITVFSKQAVIRQDDMQITLVDTPGHADFSAETERTLAVLDAAVLVISSADGLNGHTRFLYNLLVKHKIPVFVFFNKMDMAGSDKKVLLNELKTGIDTDRTFVDFTGSLKDPEFSDELALSDETLMEAYIESGTSFDDEVIKRTVSGCKVVPCYFGSALKNEGVTELMDGLTRFLEDKKYPEDPSMRVYKISADEKDARLTFAKITGGHYEVRDLVERYGEKIEQIRLYSGRSYESIKRAEAGMMVAFTGLGKSAVGDDTSDENEKDAFLPVSEPVLRYKVISKNNTDPAVLLSKLRILEEEEPSLNVSWEEEKREILIRLMGQVQLEVIERILKERFGESVGFDRGSIVYKETIAEKVEGMGHFEPLRHYAEVHLILEPGEEGSGVVIDNICDGDLLSKNWQNLILTHLTEKKFRGKLTGSEITDIKITLAAGKAHLKHTEGGDFRQAVYRAVRNGVMKAQAVLLEPWYSFRLTVPEYAVGRAMTDLGMMDAVFSLSESHAGTGSEIKGIIPASEGINYADELRKYTKGEGRIELGFSGYKPCHNPDEVMEKIGYDAERDIRNTGDSVFCEHGAGIVIPWYEADKRMHIPPVLGDNIKTDCTPVTRGGNYEAKALSIDEIDAIIERTYYSNRKKGSKPVRDTRQMIMSGTLKDEADVKKGESSPRNEKYTGRSEGKEVEKFILIDGYNVIHAWEELKMLADINVDSARDKLLDIVCNYRGLIDESIIVVFDAYRVKGHAVEYLDHDNIHVVYTKEAQTADSYIERFAHKHASEHDVTVVTSDHTEQVIVLGKGCRVVSSRDFKGVVTGKINEASREFTGRERSSINRLQGLE